MPSTRSSPRKNLPTIGVAPVRSTRSSARAAAAAAAGEITVDEGLRRLAEYQREHGHVKVPSTYEADLPLAQWVANQRIAYRDYMAGKEDADITVETISKLNEFGFHFESPSPSNRDEVEDDTDWDEMYGSLVEYSTVTASGRHNKFNSTKMRRMNRWKAAQRRDYKRYLRKEADSDNHEPASHLNDERIEKLNAMGFEWDEEVVAAPGDEATTVEASADSQAFPEKARPEAASTAALDDDMDNSEDAAKMPAATNQGGSRLTWSRNRTAWDVMFARLKAYSEKHGHANVPKTYKDDRKLANFVSTQRKEYKRYQTGQKPYYINEERIQQLESIGMRLITNRLETWESMYEQLEAYHASHGDCRIPKTSKEHAKLAGFVATQRKQYKVFQKMKLEEEEEASLVSTSKQRTKPTSTCSLTAERVALLDNLDFDWELVRGANPESWMAFYGQLEEFKKEHGHTRVPKTHKNKRLATWVKTQRRDYKRLEGHREGGLPDTSIRGIMKQDRIDMLNAIGFSWEVQGQSSWDTMYQALVAYVNETGSARVPKNYSQNQKLSNWCSTQRAEYRKKVKEGTSSLTDERYQLLEQVGFGFGRETWDDMLKQYKDWKATHDGEDPKKKENAKLATWVITQRKEYRRYQEGHHSYMTPQRIAKLDETDKEWMSTQNLGKRKAAEINPDPVSDDLKPPASKKVAASNPLETLNLAEPSPEPPPGAFVSGAEVDATVPAFDPPPPTFYSTWPEMFVALQHYKNQQGDCTDLARDDPKLSDWLKVQRREAKRLQDKLSCHMTLHQLDLLIALGVIEPEDDFVERRRNGEFDSVLPKAPETRKKSARQPVVADDRPSTWDDMYDRLKAFHEFKGHSDVPKTYQEDPQLAKFVKKQRETSVKLDPAKKAKLEALNFDFTIKKGWKWETWNTMFQRLKDFAEEHGNPNVPHNYEQDKKLANWCITQRRQYRKLQAGQRSASITQVQVDQLSEIGFRWGETQHSDAWNAMYSQLQAYKALKGTTRVPRTYKEDPKLGQWVRRQRREYRRRKNGEKSYMTTVRIDRLNELGFEWEPSSTPIGSNRAAMATEEVEMELVEHDEWQGLWARLKLFKDQHGHTSVPRNYEPDLKLAEWVEIQRLEYAKSLAAPEDVAIMGSPPNISADQILQLNELGFDWNLPPTDPAATIDATAVATTAASSMDKAIERVVMESLAQYDVTGEANEVDEEDAVTAMDV